MRSLNKEVFLKKYPHVEEYIEKNKIKFEDLQRIYKDFVKFEGSYYNQADFIANILRSNENVHSVKSRISVLHIFKDQWKDIHDFIIKTWNVIEITANIRDGDDRSIFDNLGIEVISRQSGYRSVHYLVECYPTNQKVIAEIQVRTIFEEGYGEIDHRLRYSHNEIPEILKSNLLLFNRIVGSADEMASLINMLNNNLDDKDNYYESKLKEKDEEIRNLKEEIEKLK